MSPLNLGGRVALNRWGRTGPPSADWFNNRYLLPPGNKCSFGYYDQNQDPSAFEALFGRKVDHTTGYQLGVSAKTSNSPSLNDTSIIRANIAGHLAAGRLVRQSIGFQALVGQQVVKATEFWARVADGTLDEDGVAPDGSPYKGIKSWMRMLTTLGRRIIVSPWHEFDGDNGLISVDSNGYSVSSGGTLVWFGSDSVAATGTAAADRDLIASNFRAAWRHVVVLTRNIVAAEGGFEPVWLFVPAFDPGVVTASTYGKPRWGDTLTDTGSDGFYPGHDVVDIVGWDPYNHGGLQAQPGANWNTPGDLFNNGGTQYRSAHPTSNWYDDHFKVGGAHTIAAQIGSEGVYKPAMWGETGTNEYWPGSPYSSNYIYPFHRTADGDAAVWMQQLIDLVSPGGAAYGKLKYITWFGVDYWTPKVIPYVDGGGVKHGMSGFDDTVLRLQFTDSSGTVWTQQRGPMIPVLGQADAFKTR